MSPGDRFGRLEYLGETDAGVGAEVRAGVFRCDCGQLTVQHFTRVLSGTQTECRFCVRRGLEARRASRGAFSALRRKYLRELDAVRQYTKQKVARGEIRVPSRCEICEGGGRIHCHHERYAEPDLVVFLCGTCHHRRHRRLLMRGRDPSVVYARAREAGAQPAVRWSWNAGASA